MRENRGDVDSDLSVFHRIDDPAAIHPQRLIDLVVRLGFYAGAVQARFREQARAEDAEGARFTGNDADRVVDSGSVALAIDPVLGELIDFG